MAINACVTIYLDIFLKPHLRFDLGLSFCQKHIGCLILDIECINLEFFFLYSHEVVSNAFACLPISLSVPDAKKAPFLIGFQEIRWC